ncbi:MAG: biotin--[acetyl-CoA-carboxylase] ligase [Nitrospinaceae bacterium]|nr:biotin--[acetyl-CoA-carboxylase] ligase [Nitrospinaceae bacterium]NIR54172.1 biotin--[acetyl-CoA-carboxylase] ligase [Nitrospinaceae bacterium]NIS84590.1 biotin--[acetyl-CoA-carboxylase] ligase [Nitrospinaceae bacterium]NIT81382.1 biotin--[acetyl-CoA-carboxylase] ligase [Nitrospinaceae bacterium]NIU43669.1 biotin--[acetyl-CoA-carboxylase] ligase [Nitrospinaceae bacterium]
MTYSTEDTQWIQSQLNTSVVGSQIEAYDSIDSTNDHLKGSLAGDIAEGTVILADTQTHGKGRLGRDWYSEKGVGIYLSVLLKPALPSKLIPQITLIAGLAAVEAVNGFSQARAFLKWPNDIFLNHKKVGGILSENHQEEEHSGVILGIGLNINHTGFPEPLKTIATSLAIENGAPVDRLPIIASFLNRLDRHYQAFLASGLQPFLIPWTQNSEMFDKRITVTRGPQTYTGTAQKIDSEGRLVVLLESGEEIALDSGEVTLKE